MFLEEESDALMAGLSATEISLVQPSQGHKRRRRNDDTFIIFLSICIFIRILKMEHMKDVLEHI